jgi:MiaB/RimO family radical SAM methylthiotransferase
MAPLKLASGCDRRCSFCAIPNFRGSFLSRPPAEVLAEARWLAGQGVTELVLVSENSTSYGKDAGDLRSLEKLLPELTAVPGIARVRVAYLQPAEMRPGLLEILAGTPGIAPYFDLSFQHSSPGLLRRMRRFGGTEDFLGIIERARALAPAAGFRTNVILGFPGETEADVAELERFLTAGRLDAVGVFGYSDEEGTEAIGLPGKLDQDEIDARVRRITDLVEELTAQRAEDRIGERVEVLLTEDLSDLEGPGVWSGHAAHQDPDADGTTTVTGVPEDAVAGTILAADVVGTEGVDLVEELTAQRAEDRIGERVEVLLTEDLADSEGPGIWLGHAAHQDPDSDGTTTVSGVPADAVAGRLLDAEVVDTDGIDLVARALVLAPAPAGR